MPGTQSIKNKIYVNTLKVYFLALGNCGGCMDRLVTAMKRFPVKWISDPGQADIIFVAGVLNAAFVDKTREIFHNLNKPYFIIKVGSCMGELNKAFENPKENYAVHEKTTKFIPIDLEINGCPPSSDEIESRMESFLLYFDLTPELTRTLDKRIDKGVFNP
ncbi:MAG: hypothetical protein ACTSUE_14550 [Promethearchaeota archaeon]